MQEMVSVAAIDFLGIKMAGGVSKKQMAELMRINGYNSENSRARAKGQADMNEIDNASVAEAIYNNSSCSNAVNIKNDTMSNTNLGLLSSYFSENGGFSSELKLGMVFHEEDNGFHPSITSLGGVQRSAEFIPRLDLSAIRSCSNSINSFQNQSGFGSPIAVMGGLENKKSSDHCGCSGFVTSFRPTEPSILGNQSDAQLTIFYGGTVNVYDDIPADKAQCIMLMASGGNYPNCSYKQLKIPASRKVLTVASSSDLRITRKLSLQRFLENRKNRLNAKAKSPYITSETDNRKPQRHNPSS